MYKIYKNIGVITLKTNDISVDISVDINAIHFSKRYRFLGEEFLLLEIVPNIEIENIFKKYKKFDIEYKIPYITIGGTNNYTKELVENNKFKDMQIISCEMQYVGAEKTAGNLILILSPIEIPEELYKNGKLQEIINIEKLQLKIIEMIKNDYQKLRYTKKSKEISLVNFKRELVKSDEKSKYLKEK